MASVLARTLFFIGEEDVELLHVEATTASRTPDEMLPLFAGSRSLEDAASDDLGVSFTVNVLCRFVVAQAFEGRLTEATAIGPFSDLTRHLPRPISTGVVHEQSDAGTRPQISGSHRRRAKRGVDVEAKPSRAQRTGPKDHYVQSHPAQGTTSPTGALLRITFYV